MAMLSEGSGAAGGDLAEALEAIGSEPVLATLLKGLVSAGAAISVQDHRGAILWGGVIAGGAGARADGAESAMRVFNLEGREMALTEGPGYRARMSGAVETSRVLGLRSGDEPVRWVKISSLPMSSSDAGWSVITIAFEVGATLNQEFAGLDAVLVGEVGANASEARHSFVKLEDALTKVGTSALMADFIYRLGDAGNLITVRGPSGQMEWTSGNIWSRPSGAGQPSDGGHAARYVTVDGREIPKTSEAPQRARRSGSVERAETVGLLLRGDLRWVTLAAVPLVQGDSGWSVLTVGLDVTSIAARVDGVELPELD